MRAALGFALALCCACSKTGAGGDGGGAACGLSLSSWSQADALFQHDPAWIGSDAAYSIDLGGSRVLWLFGDTFIAKDGARTRQNAWFIRNSVGIQSGSYDPSSPSAVMTFTWKAQTNGAASSFIPENGTHWFWPLSGVRLSSRLVLFVLEEEPSTSGLGFQAVGTKIIFVTNPDADPATWMLSFGDLPTFAFPIAFGAAVVHDGVYVYAFGDEEPGDHSVYVARFDAASLDGGDASQPLFFTSGQWRPPTGSPPPDVIFPFSSSLDNPPTEFSVQKRTDGTWLAVHSIGFGSTHVAVRTAPAPEGPWTFPCDAFTPPESSRTDVLVYAAKAHPELAGLSSGGSPVITYATNSTNSAALASDMSLYFPRFVH